MSDVKLAITCYYKSMLKVRKPSGMQIKSDGFNIELLFMFVF